MLINQFSQTNHQPAGILEHVAQNDRWDVAAAVSHADVGAVDLVL